MATSVVSGAALGAALTASGVYLPSVLIRQFQAEDFHMLQIFLTATAASVVVTYTANALGYTSFAPRSYADRGMFAPYDGNLIGGLAHGTGMALAGACPGTVLAQSALNIRSGYYALGGSFVGGAVWALFLRPILAAKKAEKAKTEAKPVAPLPASLPALLNVSTGTAAALFEAFLAAAIGTAVLHSKSGFDNLPPPVLGGLFVGLAQLLSVGLRKSTLGVSSVYEDFGDWLAYLSGKTTKRPGVQSFLFALGVMAGARATAIAFPVYATAAQESQTSAITSSIVPATAALGGFAMALGARLAGGCTSGHGISGMSLMSFSSMITIAATFFAGSLVAYFL